MHATIQSRFAPILYVVIFFAGFLTACLWFNPKDYLADLAPVVAAVCAVALVWLAWTAVSVIARKKNEWLRREKLIQQEKVHPVLHASLQSVEEQPEMLALTIRNHGKGMAKNIRLQVSSVSDKAAERAIVEAVSKLVIVGDGLDREWIVLLLKIWVIWHKINFRFLVMVVIRQKIPMENLLM